MALSSHSEVETRDDLVRFLRTLCENVQSGEAPAKNRSSADLIEAAAGWIEDMDGYFINQGNAVPDTPSWGLIAMVFQASLVYE